MAPLRDAATHETVTEAALARPAGYVLTAPVSNTLDTLTLLSLRQHAALLASLVVLYLLWRWRARRAPRPTAGRRLRRQALHGAAALAALLVVYAAAVLLPRPMAALDAAPQVLTIDFHAHTRFSHDGRRDWTPEHVRAWHREAGFSGAYITDHRTFEGARDAWSNNPPLAGEGVVLLPAIEAVWRGEHVNLLDADRRYRGLLTPTLRDIDEEALALASAVPGNEPLLIQTLPGDLSRIIAARGPRSAGVRAIELVDGAPRGLGQTRRERPRILHLADSLDLALVAGTDHHGWGYAAPGWTLLAIPGWRGMSPDQLSSAIAATLRTGGRLATRVVERYVADTEGGWRLPLTAPLVLWGMLRALSGEERIVWLAWIAALYALLHWRAVRRARRRASA